MKYLSNKKGFLGIDNKINIKEKVVIVPFGLEKTVSYGGGTNRGPKEIIKASHQVELFDEDLNKEPCKNIGIRTLQPFPIKKNIIDALKQIENINKILLDNKKFPFVLGGEHSLTPGAIRPFVKKFGKICLLHFDAHADLRDKYNDNKFGIGVILIKDDLPEPETPVTHVKTPTGIFTVIFCKLFLYAPSISIKFLGFTEFFGKFIDLWPDKYFAVIDILLFKISLRVPWTHISPPCFPAPGPISII